MPFHKIANRLSQTDYRKKKAVVSSLSSVVKRGFTTFSLHKPAFTLIELLVVIAILATLAGAIIYSTTNTREKGRDAKRKEELKSLASALTLYYADNNKYPLSTDGELKILDYSSDIDNWLPQLDNYLQEQPKDPSKASLSNSLAGIFKKYTNQIVSSNNAQGQVAGATTDSWTIAYDTTETGIRSLIFDYTHKVVYAASALNGLIYRCDTITSCDTASDWTLSLDSPPSAILSLTTDSANGIIYAGLGDIGDIYRCATSTGCDASSDWTVSLDSPITNGVSSLTFDSANGVIYAGLAGDIYRCATSTGCDASANWTVSHDTNETTINSLAFDAVNNIIYAGSNDNIYRCATSTGCDASADWTVSYNDNTLGGIYALTFDTVNRVLYAGASSSNIYRCATSTGCDASSDWTVSYASTAGPILSLTFDSINGDLYAGTYGGGGLIYRCPISTGCTSATNWLISYDAPDSSIYSLTFDSVNSVIYAGSSIQGYILRSGPATVPPPPPTTLTCTPSTHPAINIGGTATFSAINGNGTYKWNTPDGSPVGSPGQTLQVTYNTSGSKNVTVESGSETSAPCSVQINPQTPPTDIDNPGGDPGSTGGACDGKNEIYCYRVSWDQKHFVLWAQLENINDPQIYNSTSGTATCTETPPTGSFLNYCLKSAE